MIIREKLISQIYSDILGKKLSLTLCWAKNGSYRINIRGDDFERGFNFALDRKAPFCDCDMFGFKAPVENFAFKIENFEISTAIAKKRKIAKICVSIFDAVNKLCFQKANFLIKLSLDYKSRS